MKWIDLLSSRSNGLSIFNIGTGKPHSVLEVIDIFENVNGISIPHQFVERNRAISENAGLTARNLIVVLTGDLILGEVLKHAWKWKSENPSGPLNSQHETDTMPV